MNESRRVMEPGIYTMPIADYVADPAPEPSMSTGTASALLTQSPLHAKMQHPRLNPTLKREPSSRADIGTIAHALLLEGDNSKVVEVDAKDWRTNAAKEQRDAAYAVGKIPVLKEDYASVKAMVDAAMYFLMGSTLAEDWLAAKEEQTLIWQQDGVWCRSRPDKLTLDHRVYFDYKTAASAHPATFSKTSVTQGYDLQIALGRRGVKALTGIDCRCVFVVQEIEEPYACSLVEFSPMFLTIADERLTWAMERFRRCLTRNVWPGYPETIATVDPPGWYGMEELEALS